MLNIPHFPVVSKFLVPLARVNAKSFDNFLFWSSPRDVSLLL